MKYLSTILILGVTLSVNAQNVDFRNLIGISLTKLPYDTTIRASRYNVQFSRIEARYEQTVDSVFIDTLRTTFVGLDSNLVSEKLFTFLWDYYGSIAAAQSVVIASGTPPNELALVENALTNVTSRNFLDNARIRHSRDYLGKWVLIYNGTRYRMLATLEPDRIRFRQVDANNQPVQGGFNGRIRLYNTYYLSLVNVVAPSTTIDFVPDLKNPGRFISTTGSHRLWPKRN